ncbi:hypothetical protein M9H77_03424 [Catharanthus roseus]|uniref:Uncharacterized protein n=1 Tax=Catharanthus roseus TaxID=4058 RepID=A0ACC0CBP0_CATRO|nr:hypothetical protein M9H77_03424 [Catharanthus roseus]
MRESYSDISSPLNLLSNKEKFEAQNMENEGSLCYKLYKTISFLASTFFLSFIINIQSQFFNFLTITCGTKLNHGMRKKLSTGYEDTSISLSLNLFSNAMSYLATSCTRRLKTLWLKVSNEEFHDQIEVLEEFTGPPRLIRDIKSSTKSNWKLSATMDDKRSKEE